MDDRLVLIGGVPRTGKSALAASFLADGYAWYATDVMRMIAGGATGGWGMEPMLLGDDAEALTRTARGMLPQIRRLAGAALAQHHRVLIEGWELLPEHVQALRREFEPDVRVRAVFLGNSAYSLDDLEADGGRNRWADFLSDDARAVLPARLRELGEHIAASCARVGETYVDLGVGDRAERLDEVRALLLDG